MRFFFSSPRISTKMCIRDRSCVTPFQAEVKRAFIRAADQVILLIEHGKFDIDALMVFARFEEIDCIVTSEPIASPDLATHLDKLGVKVIVAK